MKKTVQTQVQGKPLAIPNTPLAYMWFLVKGYRGIVIFSILVATLAELATTSTAYIIKHIVDSVEGLLQGLTTQNDVVFWALMFPTVVFLADILWRISGFTGMRWMTRANADSYKLLFKYLGQQSHTYFSDRFAGSLASKVTHASEGSQSLYESFLWNFYPGMLGLVLTAIYISTINIFAAMMFIMMLLILIPLNVTLAKYRRPHVVRYSEQITKSRGYLVDTVTNISAVRQYAALPYEQSRIGKEFDTVRLLNIKQWGISEWGLVVNNVVIAIFQFTIVYIVLYLWRSGTLSSGELLMVMVLLLNVTGTLVFIGSSINNFIRKYAEIQEGLTDILKNYDIVDAPHAEHLHVTNAQIKFSDVNFSFDNNHVFKNFDLLIESNQRLGLVGPSGAGKTTFVSLLLRQHDVTEGAILIDDQNIAMVTQDSLRQAIAVVPQEPALFHRTIRENIAYGKPEATDEEIIAVAKKAHAHDFISALSEGYDTLVGERGVKLSGGQKQRIAIARAMLKDAPILVLDEATSALDSESEVEIQKALHTLMAGKTVIAIAHRLSTLREMDRIIVLENGAITEDGTHDALVAYNGTYARLWAHQAGGFMAKELDDTIKS